MCDVTLDNVLPQTPGMPPPARPPIQDISQWSERYCLMAGILATRFPDKAPELFAYRTTTLTPSAPATPTSQSSDGPPTSPTGQQCQRHNPKPLKRSVGTSI